jgi:hypothetical protein
MLAKQTAAVALDAGPRPQLLKRTEIERMLNISRFGFEALIARGLLSRGIDLGPGTKRWELAEVQALIASRKLTDAHAA